MNARLTAIDEDNTATFSTASRPGSRPIVSAYIADESQNISKADGTRYAWPSAPVLQQTLGSAINAVIHRAGWVSGNALGIVNNSAQDANAYKNVGREVYRTWDYDSGGALNVPQLVITYTPGAPAMGVHRTLLHVGR